MKTLAVIKYVFAAIGTTFMAVAAFWVVHTRSFISEASLAEGTVVGLVASRSSGNSSTSWRPTVRFVAADGRAVQFTSSASSNPPSYAQGERVTVLYSGSNPQDAAIRSFESLWLGPLIFGGLGLVFFSIGAGMMLVPRLAAQRAARLRTTGMPLQTRLQGVEQNTSVSVNGAHPYRIAAQWQDPATGEIHVFRSENLWFDPSEHVKRDSITVYIEPGNPRKYWVDVSFLPKLAD